MPSPRPSVGWYQPESFLIHTETAYTAGDSGYEHEVIVSSPTSSYFVSSKLASGLYFLTSISHNMYGFMYKPNIGIHFHTQVFLKHWLDV